MASMKTSPGLVNFFIYNSTFGPKEGMVCWIILDTAGCLTTRFEISTAFYQHFISVYNLKNRSQMTGCIPGLELTILIGYD